MKKSYETPSIEVIEIEVEDAILETSGSGSTLSGMSKGSSSW